VASETTSNVMTRPPPPDRPLPPHVPKNLLHDLWDYQEANTRLNPFDATKNIYQELPPIFYTHSRFARLFEGAWVVTRYEDIREVYQNAELYSTADAANFQELIGETWPMIPLAIDPPDHGKYRILLNPWFSPGAINALEPKIRATINELIDEFADKGECDLNYDFGRSYPVRVFMDLMGFPRERFEDFLKWEYALLHSRGDLDRVRWGMRSALDYLRGFIEEVRARPDGNLTSHIVHGKVDGRPCTEDEIIGAVAFLWIGGLDTVAATTSLLFRRLALDPELQNRLRGDDSLMPAAIEEFLRMQPLVNSTRLVKKDHEFLGQQIKAGDHIMAFNAAGNFDPNEFDDPWEFKLDRPSNRHFTLAGGPHRCLGSHLARRELRIAVSEFLRRIPEFKLKPGEDAPATPGLIAVPKLPIVWNV